MPVVDVMDRDLVDKLMEYSLMSPQPMSIEEMIECGDRSIYSEEASFTFLKKEMAIRIAHMIMELQRLPKDLHEEEVCMKTMDKYSTTFKEVIEFQDMEPSDVVLKNFKGKLVTFRNRHKDTTLEMGQACKAMKEKKEKSATKDDIDQLFSSFRIVLDRFFTSRISIHMITNHHLELFSKDRVQNSEMGLIRRKCDIRSILSDVVDEVTMYMENVYMACPKVDIKMYKNAREITEPVEGALVPGHLTFIFTEVLKNSMRATVEHHFKDLENLPPVTATICQADDYFTIKISDCGGGMDRDSAAKCFMYQYSTPSKYCEGQFCLFLTGSGLPMARLYARYFQGEIKMASYEGYGTDVYIYLSAVPHVARESLPVYKRETRSALEWDQWEQDWSSWSGTSMMHNMASSSSFLVSNEEST